LWKCVTNGVWNTVIIFTRAVPEKAVGERRVVRYVSYSIKPCKKLSGIV
jgi:hypothetical protein